MGGHGVQMMNAAPLEVACGQDEVTGEFSDSELFDQRHDALYVFYSMFTLFCPTTLVRL